MRKCLADFFAPVILMWLFIWNLAWLIFTTNPNKIKSIQQRIGALVAQAIIYDLLTTWGDLWKD